MVIVESISAFHRFLQEFRTHTSVVIPVMSDAKAHPMVNSVCLLYVWLDNGHTFILPFDHNETQNLPADCLNDVSPVFGFCYTPDKKLLGHLIPVGVHTQDLNGMQHVFLGSHTDSETFYTPAMRHMLMHFWYQQNLYKAIPLMQIIAYCEAYLTHLKRFLDLALLDTPGYKFHNNIVIPACTFMEQAGVRVDPEIYVKHYGERSARNIVHGLVYTEYNPYTTTRRVTNKHNNVNYAAIDKSSGVRDGFVSRFDRGSVVLVDWESFHLRLIAELMDYKLPDEPVHEYLAKQYFQTTNPTPEQYDEGKQITFKNLYGQGDSKIDFFVRVRAYIDLVWETVQQGFIETDEFNRITLDHIEQPNPGKVFNYLLQLRETEVAMRSIFNLRSVFEGRNSKVTLYTYDSLLIDLDMSEAKELLPKVVEVMEHGGKFPIRLYAGQSYGTLKNITKIVKPNN